MFKDILRLRFTGSIQDEFEEHGLRLRIYFKAYFYGLIIKI